MKLQVGQVWTVIEKRRKPLIRKIIVTGIRASRNVQRAGSAGGKSSDDLLQGTRPSWNLREKETRAGTCGPRCHSAWWYRGGIHRPATHTASSSWRYSTQIKESRRDVRCVHPPTGDKWMQSKRARQKCSGSSCHCRLEQNMTFFNNIDKMDDNSGEYFTSLMSMLRTYVAMYG